MANLFNVKDKGITIGAGAFGDSTKIDNGASFSITSGTDYKITFADGVSTLEENAVSKNATVGTNYYTGVGVKGNGEAGFLANGTNAFNYYA